METVQENGDVGFGPIVDLREHQQHFSVCDVGGRKTAVNRAKCLDWTSSLACIFLERVDLPIVAGSVAGICKEDTVTFLDSSVIPEVV
jgi:hypothetical protein